MIEIYTNNQDEYVKAQEMVAFLKKNLCDSTVINVYEPKDSICVKAWSVDDIREALEEDGVNTGNISDEILLKCADQLDIGTTIDERVVSKASDLIADSVDEIIKSLNDETGSCNHRWEESDEADVHTCKACQTVSTPEDYKCKNCNETFSLFDKESYGACPYCGSDIFIEHKGNANMSEDVTSTECKVPIEV